ncbi:hypothetical protein FACS1894156_7200 [Bacteroidia bacterium]|nr:hypothetical protein FACS1894156_7200 [Bacteroidia bacterium]
MRFFWFFAAVVVLLLIFTTNCARIGRPEGGPKDSTPPVLLKTVPLQGATNFKKKKVRIYFNEYMQLKDQSKQFLVSPPMAKTPLLTVYGKSVEVKFNAPLADSTTYVLNFGNSLADNNEGNIYPNYRYAFSTGNVLDSLQMFGLALDAATHQPLEMVYAYLYEDFNDSVVFTQRPRSLARSDKWGFFTPQNLKSRPYKVVLLADENRNYQYDIGQEAIGFFEGNLHPAHLVPPPHWDSGDRVSDTGSLRQPQFTIRMFKEEFKKQYFISAARKERKAFTLIFNAPHPQIDSLQADSSTMDLSQFTIEHSVKYDTLTYWVNDTAASLPDSLFLSFVYAKTDSADLLTPTKLKQKLFFEEKEKPDDSKAPKKGGGIGSFLKGIVGIVDTVADTLPQKPAHWTLKPTFKTANVNPIAAPTFNFTSLLFAVQPNNIRVEEISINPKSKDTTYIVLPTQLQQDTLRLRNYTLRADWKEKATYRYQILPDAFTDIYGQTNDTIRGKFNSTDPEKTAQLTFLCRNVEQPYLLQITDAKGVNIVREYTVGNDSTPIKALYLPPAAYRIKVIKDDNNNGKWDTGNYFEHRQPEYANFLQNTDGSLDFVLKANWEQEITLDVLVLFPDVADIVPPSSLPTILDGAALDDVNIDDEL